MMGNMTASPLPQRSASPGGGEGSGSSTGGGAGATGGTGSELPGNSSGSGQPDKPGGDINANHESQSTFENVPKIVYVVGGIGLVGAIIYFAVKKS